MKVNEKAVLNGKEETTSDDARFLIKRFALTAFLGANAGTEEDFERVWRCAFPERDNADVGSEPLKFRRRFPTM